MGIISRLKTFASMGAGTTKPTDKVAATKTITNELVSYLLGLSDFNSMTEEEIYEQLYTWEPEIGGAIDRMSTMVGESFKYCCLRADTEGPSKLHDKMVKDANRLAEEIDVRNYFEMLSEILVLHGNLYLERKNIALDILPNKYVTLVDKRERLTSATGTNMAETIITEPNLLILYEGDTAQRILTREQFIHVRYKSTPTYSVDRKGRTCYGVYSPSPLHRVILPVWWKRQTMIIDIMWRLMNVPREHHKIDAMMFSLDKYVGSPASKREQATADAQTFLNAYTEGLRNRVPDQGYATLSTVEIEKLDNKSSSYMQTNELIEQINSQIWTALNMPKSMIAGESTSSYASELVIAGYVTQKVTQLSSKLKPIILQVLRDRLRTINSAYPVDDLDLFMDLDIAVTELEKFRQMAIMADLSIFTEDEIREYALFKPLREDQRSKLVTKDVQPASMQVPNIAGSPETPQSHTQHSTDKGQNMYKASER
jgi:hypothetical protein